MRRLLASVAVLAAALLAPSAASATPAPEIQTPAPVSASNATPAPVTVHLTWTSVGLLVTYHVFRDTIAPGASCALAHSGTDVSGALVDGLAYDDAVSAEDIYCYWVQADDLMTGATDSLPVQFTYDTTPPAPPVVIQSGGNGCSPFTLLSATASDNLGPVTITTGGPFPYTPPGTGVPFESLVPGPSVTATDAAGNTTSVNVAGITFDPDRPPAPVLEVDTDPAQQKATLSWDISAPDNGAPITNYRIRTRGPQGVAPTTLSSTTSSIAMQNLEPDATYEFTLDATDICGFGSTSVRLVRLNDTTPPTTPIVAGPSFNPATRVLTLSWVPSTDNIQVDHYEIRRNGVPLGATDSTTFTDLAPPQHANLSYVVRAVDTNGNTTDSAPASYSTPDWTPPTAPVPTITVKGSTVTVRWSPAADNVGVIGYDVLRDNKVKGTMTAAIRVFTDLNVPPGVHTWSVRARDDAGLSAVSAPQSAKIVKSRSSARVVSLKKVGDARVGAARYSLAGPSRLLLDLKVVGTMPKARLRVYVQNGKGRITVWRGVPGSSTPRLRLNSALVRHGYVTIKLGRTFHSGRIRLVLITSGRMVVVATGKHQPSIKAG
jgi:hypothetical protein